MRFLNKDCLCHSLRKGTRGLIIFLSLSLLADSQEIVVRPPSGDLFIVDLQPEESFVELSQKLQNDYHSSGEVLFDFGTIEASSVSKNAATTQYRNYYQNLQPQDIEDISFIVNTLGMNSLAKITKSKSKLKKVGKRVDHVHPLKFLTCIFSSDRLKASIQALRGRDWVWHQFIDGIKDSLEEETNKDNMKIEYIQDFASAIGMNIDLIYPYISQRKWEQFVGLLVSTVPRNPDADRYNM